MKSPEQTDREEDDRNIPHYEIEGYNWFLVQGEHIGPDEGTLFPGHGEEVYKLVEKAGYSLDLEATYYVAIMVDDGDYDWLPEFRAVGDQRDQINDAMEERATTIKIADDGYYWTLKQAREVEA